MGLERVVFVVVMFIYNCLQMEVCSSTVYKVGDSAGWTTIGNVDYKQWAATKTFQLNDIILFKYSSQFHNVMQVKHVDYKSCNASFPIATHTTGNDSITITTHGHHLFLCGVPGHCQAGQKVDINVLSVSALRPSPSTSSSAAAAAAAAIVPVPAPSPSEAAPSYALRWFLFQVLVVMTIIAALF